MYHYNDMIIYRGAQKNLDTHVIYIDLCTNARFFKAVAVKTNNIFTAAVERCRLLLSYC